MRIGILHGWFLSGSGSNVYVQNTAKTLWELGHDVHVFCLEREAAKYQFVSQVIIHDEVGNIIQSRMYSKKGIVVHVPDIGKTLPVFVWDAYPSFDRVVEFVKIDRKTVHMYLEQYVKSILESGEFDVLHANHAIMMPIVARQVKEKIGTPYVIALHGSAIVYAVEKHPACFEYALQGLEKAESVLVGNKYFKSRVLETFAQNNPEIVNKIVVVPLGVDTSTFLPWPNEMNQEGLKSILVQKTEQFLGRTTKQSERIRQLFSYWVENNEISSEVFKYVEQYSQKHPDADLTKRLSNLDRNIPTVIYVGRLILGKGIQDLLVSFCELAENRNVQLVVVGAGPIREWLEGFVWFRKQGLDSMIKPWIEVARKNIAGHKMLETISSWLGNIHQWQPLPELKVVFTGFMDHSLLRHVLPCADIAVFPSLIPESFGLVALEAAASGVIPLVSDFSGLKDSAMKFEEQIPELKEGMLRFPLEPNNRIQILSKRIDDALILSKNKSIQDKVRMVCEKIYSWNSVTKQLVQVYESCV
jgi:glycosyltransferase involved in cell wall biosynthesis